MPFVAIKMGRRRGGPSRTGSKRAHLAPFLHWGEKPEQRECKNGAGCNRRATQPPTHFHRNPLDRGQLAVFPRYSLLAGHARVVGILGFAVFKPFGMDRNEI